MRLAAFKDLTRFEQTFFALPFILGSMLLSLPHATFSLRWIFVIPAFMFARISGMAFNQLIDRKIDAQNPRTAKRAIPSGRVTLKQARCVAWGALVLFVMLCLQINLLTAMLAPLAALLLYIYSYMKRIHYFCHAVLGLIHFLGPVMAFTALNGTISLTSFFLGSVAALSIIGTDITYAIQDYEFDCQNRLFSVPSKFGIKKSLQISACSHFFALCSLLAVGLSAHLPVIYYFVLPTAGMIYFYFHWSLRKREGNLKNIEPAFFNCAISISFAVLFFIVLSTLWRVLS